MPYVYEPLDKSAKQIRLITVLPGSGYSPLRCELQVVELAASPQYEALSYEWGVPEPSREILLGDEVFKVRENLGLALSHLRPPKNSQTLWIDAICIDQSNISERNIQVQMMSKIYQKASLVRAWLGPEIGSTKDAFKLLYRFKKAHSGERYSRHVRKITARERISLWDLTKMTYWSRVWIVQELVLAKEIVLHCGEESIAWLPMLLAGLRQAGYLHSPAGLVLSLRDGKRRNSLLVLMRTCYKAQAGEERDRVYALLGIAEDVTQRTIVVNYGIALTDLRAQVGAMYRSQELEAAPLLYAELGRSTTEENMCDPELGFSRYMNAYFRDPGLFGQIEDVRTLAVSTSYHTGVVKEKLRSVLWNVENSDNLSAIGIQLDI